jgi:pimeloyl-ACP methyl ester carboxylesterase
LGIAQSQHGEPVNEIQSALEIAALYTLTNLLRKGKIPEIKNSFDKIVHVGHSFGSIQSYSLTVLHPDASDGLILTGFSQVSDYIPYFGLGGNFIGANTITDFKDYPDGYLASSDLSGVQTNFFAPGAFAPEVLALAFLSGQPVTVGELLTIGAQSALPNPLKGPVLIITGGKWTWCAD